MTYRPGTCNSSHPDPDPRDSALEIRPTLILSNSGITLLLRQLVFLNRSRP